MLHNPNSYFTVNAKRDRYSERGSDEKVEGVDADVVKTRRHIEHLEEQIRFKRQLRDDFILEEPSNAYT